MLMSFEFVNKPVWINKFLQGNPWNNSDIPPNVIPNFLGTPIATQHATSFFSDLPSNNSYISNFPF